MKKTVLLLFGILVAGIPTFSQNVYEEKDPYKDNNSVRFNYMRALSAPTITIKGPGGTVLKTIEGANKFSGGLAYYNRNPMARGYYFQLEGRFNILSAEFDTDGNGTKDESFNNVFDIELGVLGGKYLVSNMLSAQAGILVTYKDGAGDLDIDDYGTFEENKKFWLAYAPTVGVEFKINKLILLSARYIHYLNHDRDYTYTNSGGDIYTANVQLSRGFLELGLGLKF